MQAIFLTAFFIWHPSVQIFKKLHYLPAYLCFHGNNVGITLHMLVINSEFPEFWYCINWNKITLITAELQKVESVGLQNNFIQITNSTKNRRIDASEVYNMFRSEVAILEYSSFCFILWVRFPPSRIFPSNVFILQPIMWVCYSL